MAIRSAISQGKFVNLFCMYEAEAVRLIRFYAFNFGKKEFGSSSGSMVKDVMRAFFSSDEGENE